MNQQTKSMEHPNQKNIFQEISCNGSKSAANPGYLQFRQSENGLQLPVKMLENSSNQIWASSMSNQFPTTMDRLESKALAYEQVHPAFGFTDHLPLSIERTPSIPNPLLVNMFALEGAPSNIPYSNGQLAHAAHAWEGAPQGGAVSWEEADPFRPGWRPGEH